MLNDDIEKTLREHSPVPPAGFAERSDAQVLRQACRAADDYVRARAEKRPRRSWRGVLLMMAGAGITGLCWALSALIR